MTDADIRANAIRESNLEGPFTEGHKEASFSEEEVINSSPPLDDDANTNKLDAFAASSPGSQSTARKSDRTNGSKVTIEYAKQKKSSLGPLLPSEVCFLAWYMIVY